MSALYIAQIITVDKTVRTYNKNMFGRKTNALENYCFTDMNNIYADIRRPVDSECLIELVLRFPCTFNQHHSQHKTYHSSFSALTGLRANLCLFY